MFSMQSLAQVIDFTVADTVCINEKIALNNNSSGFSKYEWDFCFENFSTLTPSFESFSNTGLSLPFEARIIKSDTSSYVLMPNRNNETIKRYHVSTDFNKIYSENNVENIASFFQQPISVDVISINNKWIGYACDYSLNRIYVLDFGSNLSSSPTINQLKLNSITLSGPSRIHIENSNDSTFLFVSNYGTPKLSKIVLDNSDPFSTIVEDEFLVPGANGLASFDIIKYNANDWMMLLGQLDGNNLIKLKFNSSLNSVPVIENLAITGDSYTQPTGPQLFKEGNAFYGLLISNAGNFFRLDFGEDIEDIPAVINYGINTGSTASWSLDVIKNGNSRFTGLFPKYDDNSAIKVSFDDICNAIPALTSDTEPLIKYTASGKNVIALSGNLSNGYSTSITKEIIVTNNQAPAISFSTGANLCITDPISFTGISDETITSWAWDFGSSNTAMGQNPEFTFASPGTYEVTLEVEGANGCNNRIQKSVTVYEPQPVTFTSSAQGAICSQKPIAFTNTTDLPPIATYSWDFGDGNTSTLENPEHIYQASGNYTVRLLVAFAGCESSTEETITVNPGPEVSFSTIDNCLGQSITFNNTSAGDFITSYLWDFGDGTTSTQENPVYSFESAGVKNISLTAFTNNGCDYTIQQNIEVFPVAVVAFEAEIACAKQPLQFNEQVFLELSNVTDYLWDFGIAGRSDDISTFANPQFTYPEAGTYQVSLQVTTADGCVSSGQQSVTVSAVPEPIFTYAPQCVGNSITFNGNSTAAVSSQYWELSNSNGEVVAVGVNENFTYTFLTVGDYNLRYRQQNQQLCSNEYEETISILPSPLPSFIISSLCLNSAITLQNTTDLQGNTIKTYSWLIDGEVISNEENTEFTFEEAGIYTLSLEAVTNSGCTETTSQTINIEPISEVSFSLAQEVGAYPFPVSAEISEEAGFSYEWSINNEIVSTSSALNETLEAAGTYIISLSVTNADGCSSTASQQVRVRAPELDLSLGNLRIVPSGNFTEFVVSITNKGSLMPEEIDLNVDFGDYSITERVDLAIDPESTVNYALNTKLSASQLRTLNRICLSASVKSSSLTEEKKNDNRVCSSLEDIFKVMDLYPNPVTSQLTIPLIIPANGDVTVTIEQADGKQNQRFNYDLKSGYNELKLARGNLKAGVYFVRIRYQGMEEVKKVVFR